MSEEQVKSLLLDEIKISLETLNSYAKGQVNELVSESLKFMKSLLEKS